MDGTLIKLCLLFIILHLNISMCFGCQAEETRLVNKGDTVIFSFVIIIEFSNALFYFGKDYKDILLCDVSGGSWTKFPSITYYSSDYEKRLVVTRLDSENTTISLINASVSDTGTYTITNEWKSVEYCWTVFVIGIEGDKAQMIEEGTTVSFLGYPLLSTISSHPRWNISCLWLFDGKKFNVSNPGSFFRVHGDRMWIPRVSRDLDKKVVIYSCTYDDTTVEVERILSVKYTNGSECTTVVRTSGRVLDGNDVIKDGSASSLQTLTIVGISLVLIVMISILVVIAVRYTCRLRNNRRQRLQTEAQSIEDGGPNTVSRRGLHRSQFYLHARCSEPIYDLPNDLTTTYNSTTNEYLQMDPKAKPRDSYVSMK